MEADSRPGAEEPEAKYSVVVGCDFSALGDRAVVEALQLCALHPGAALHVITVGAESAVGVILPGPEPRSRPSQEARDLVRAHVAKIVDEYVARAPELDLAKVAIYVTVGAPSERILTLARAVDADLIVVGTHSRHGLERIVLGSVAEAVVRHAPCGVLVIRPRDFLGGEKLPEIQPPLQPGEHALLPLRLQPTYHYVHRLSRDTSRITL